MSQGTLFVQGAFFTEFGVMRAHKILYTVFPLLYNVEKGGMV